MVLPKFALTPTPGSPDATPQIEAALGAFRAFIDTAVVDPPDPQAFLISSIALSGAIDGLAALLGIDPSYEVNAKDAWWLDIWSAGMASTNITAEGIRWQLENLDPSSLPGRLALEYKLTSTVDRFTRSLMLGVEAVFKEMWFFYRAITLDGIHLSPRAQVLNAVDFSFGAGCMFGALHDRALLPGAEDKQAGYRLWRYSIYRLAFQLLGYQPAS